MANTPKTYTIDPDLEAALIAASGKPVHVKGTKTHRVRLDLDSANEAGNVIADIPTATNEDKNAFIAAAGSWKDEDTDTFLTNIYESRDRVSDRPPVKL